MKNSKIMKNFKAIEIRPGYYWYYVPFDKFSFFYDKNVISFDSAEDGGWIFWKHDPK